MAYPGTPPSSTIGDRLEHEVAGLGKPPTSYLENMKSKNEDINVKIWKNIKNTENIARGAERLVEVWEDPDSLPEPEHLNQLQTRHNVAAKPLPSLLAKLSYC